MEVFETHNLSITRMTKGKLPSLPFVDMKKAVVGTRYRLSIAFVGKQAMKEMSRRFKGSDTHMNVLSFPLAADEGEIIINLETVRREAHTFDKTYLAHLGYLVIHGMLHLKGFAHGSKMDTEERKLTKMFHL